MRRLLVFVLVTLAIHQHGCSANPVSTVMEEITAESDYPDGELPMVRNLHPLARSADGHDWADRPDLCYFFHGSRSEGQLSCHLRLTRSKFNFNPFGLRFGKRDRGNKSLPETFSGDFLGYLLKLKERPCGHVPAGWC